MQAAAVNLTQATALRRGPSAMAGNKHPQTACAAGLGSSAAAGFATTGTRGRVTLSVHGNTERLWLEKGQIVRGHSQPGPGY